MKKVFADSSFWIATLHPSDELFPTAANAIQQLGNVELVTTHLVTIEVLNHFCSLGPNLRTRAAQWAHDLPLSFGFRIVGLDTELYTRALRLYSDRPDKFWSFVDCASFVVMQQHGIFEALSADHHFEQAGFSILLK